MTQATSTDLVTLTIDGVSVSVPKGTLVIRAAEQIGIQIPRFCDHPLLDPVGACRQCLVEVWLPGRPSPDGSPGPSTQMQGPPGRMKPQASCTLVASDGMEVRTQVTSEGADKAQTGVMEYLLINHPLDCPVCDKGGECPLQNQAMSNGRPETRFEGVKRTFPKPINISAQVLLDRERCVLCARCTRFSEQIAGDPFIALIERGALQQVGIYEKEPYESYFSGNAIQICPVGALTSAEYRFRSRPFDLVSTSSVAEHDACGAAIRVDHRRGKVMRRMAGNDPEVNEEWITDKDRFAFAYAREDDRLTYPRIREDGELRPASWPEAFAVAARGLAAAGGVAVLTGGRVTAEDAYAFSKFARVALGTNDIDFRARPLSAEETGFLGTHVALAPPVTYADLEAASTVVLAGLEPEDEAGTIFLRLRKATRKGRTRVVSVAPFASRGLHKMGGTLVATAPGAEAGALAGLADHDIVSLDDSAVILVGERLASSPGALTAAADLALRTGARLAWVPRRAGDRGAVESGCLPTLLPGGRPVADAAARVDVAAAWGVEHVPEAAGRDADAIVAALADGDAGCPGRGRGGPRRHRRPGPHPRSARRRLRGGAGGARDRRDPGGRRGVPGRPGVRQGRHVRDLGGPDPALRGGLQQPGLAPRPAGALRHRRGARPSARLHHRRRRARRDGEPRPVGRRPAGRRDHRHQEGRRQGGQVVPGAGHVEAAHRPRLAAGRRRRDAGHRSPAGRPPQPRDVRRPRPGRRRRGHGHG